MGSEAGSRDQSSTSKRRHRRFSVDVLDMRGNAVFAHAVMIQDISVTGVSLKTDQKLLTGRPYTLRIIDDHRDLSFNVTVIWSAENEDRSDPLFRYTAGLQFSNISQDNEAGLVEFIGAHLADRYTQVRAHEMSGYRCNVRHQVDRDEAALLDMRESYQVKKLSMGGLLLEAAHAFELNTRLSMEMTFPDSGHISFIARVTSCLQSREEAGSYEIGVAFTDLPEKDSTRLKAFIKKLYLEDAGFSEGGEASGSAAPHEGE